MQAVERHDAELIHRPSAYVSKTGILLSRAVYQNMGKRGYQMAGLKIPTPKNYNAARCREQKSTSCVDKWFAWTTVNL